MSMKFHTVSIISMKGDVAQKIICPCRRLAKSDSKLDNLTVLLREYCSFIKSKEHAITGFKLMWKFPSAVKLLNSDDEKGFKLLDTIYYPSDETFTLQLLNNQTKLNSFIDQFVKRVIKDVENKCGSLD